MFEHGDFKRAIGAGDLQISEPRETRRKRKTEGGGDRAEALGRSPPR